jgi:hypothetical protein
VFGTVQLEANHVGIEPVKTQKCTIFPAQDIYEEKVVFATG